MRSRELDLAGIFRRSASPAANFPCHKAQLRPTIRAPLITMVGRQLGMTYAMLASAGRDGEMDFAPDQLVAEITALQHEAVARWHETPVDNPYDGIHAVACQQHQFNFLLWHEEDIARSPNVGDARIAAVKRAIDGYNQKRNDWIERIDDYLLQSLEIFGVRTRAGAPLNTETPGSAFDRLSIMSLRIYHMQEQLDRTDADEAHRESVRQKLSRCREQHGDLSHSLQELLADVFAGRKQLKLYRQMKMYNDPKLNPYLYEQRKAG